MKKTVFLVWLCSCTIFYGQDQNGFDLPEVIPPSPTVANLMTFEEVPVDHYSGQPDISIPLYAKNLGFGIQMPLALRYNTMGVRINSRSGWAGTGWSLEAGGVISRTVRGTADEEQLGGLNGVEIGIFHNNDFWNYGTFSGFAQQEFIWNAGGTSSQKYDHQPDLFQFSVMGLSGRFTIVKDLTTNTLSPKLLTKNLNVKIDINYHATTFALESFIITDTNGNKYTFDVLERLQSDTIVAIKYFNGEPGTSGSTTTTTNAWYLSKIESPNNIELASFNYTNVYVEYLTAVSRTENSVLNQPNWTQLMEIPYNPYVISPRSSYSHISSSGNTKKLSNITFNDGSSLDFTITNSHPETTGAILQEIKIKKADGQNLKSFSFTYEETDRLWLTKVKETAGSLSNSYHIDYNDKGNLASFDSVSDDWGYNVGTERSLCGLSAIDRSAIQKGVLTSITYPTGGAKSFVFEPHKITYQGNTMLTDDEYRDKNPDNWNVQSLSIDYDSNLHNSAEFSGLIPHTLVIGQKQEVVYNRTAVTGNEDAIFNSLIRVYNLTTGYDNRIRLDKEEVKFTLEAGTYEISFLSLTQNANITTSICFGYKKFKLNVSRFIYGGGLRIKEIAFKETPLATKSERKIHYDYGETGITNTSSGSIDGNLSGILKTYTLTQRRFLFGVNSCFSGSFLVHNIKFEVRTKEPNSEMTKGNYVGYKEVKVSESNNGYTRYIYTSPQDYYSPSAVFNYPYAPAPNIDFKRGLLLKTEVFHEDGKKLKQAVNQYKFEEDTIASSYRLYKDETCEWKPAYNYYSSYTSQNPDNTFSACGTGCNEDCLSGSYQSCGSIPYFFLSDDIKTGWAKLKETENTTFYYDGTSLTSTNEISSRTVSTYDPVNFQVNTQDVYYDEKGIEQHQQTKYFYPTAPSIYGSSTAQLNNLNKINEVVAIVQYKNGVKTNTIVNTYAEVSPNLVLVEKIASSKGQTPTTGGLAPEIFNLEDRVIYHKYDNFGNPLEVSKANGTRIYYVWGYDSKHPIAKLENVSHNTITAAQTTVITNAVNASDVDIDIASEENLRTVLNELRTAFPNAMVSTYTYNPLIGVTSVTDVKGYTSYFEYDDFNRLKTVKDAEGNMLSKNEYNYRIND